LDYANQMAQAALTGQGIALMRTPLIAESLANGSLMEVLSDLRIDSPMSYWLAISERSRVRPEVVALANWINEHAAQTQLAMERRS